MSVETKTFQPYELQQKLWGKTCRTDGLAKRTEQTRRGWIPYGLSVAELSGDLNGFSAVLGDFAPRVLSISNPNNPLTLVPEQIAVAGGWCALRTKDVVNLSEKGTIINPALGTIEKVKSTEQVAGWIESGVAFDQIVESIGAVQASEYVVISERKLWSKRIIEKLSLILERNLCQKEMDNIESSVEKAERTRAEITERYVRYITGRSDTTFQRVVDEDIWEELKQARNEMLEKAGTSLDKLKNIYPNDKTIDNTSLVWAMYSQPYFDMLRSKGYMRSKTAIVVEPAQHACVETLTDCVVAEKIYQGKGIYFDQNGFNKNTGFIAYIECVNSRGQNTRKEQTVGEVPNISNWKGLFDSENMFDPNANSTLNPADNQLFVWGTNLLPFGKTRQALIDLVDISEEFKKEKERINSQFRMSSGKINPEARSIIQQAIEGLKKELLNKILEQNMIISSELKSLFLYLTQGLGKNI